jgi:hypothetical protein
MRPAIGVNTQKTQRFPELPCAADTRIDRDQVGKSEASFNQRGREKAADAALSPSWPNIEAPETHGLERGVGLDGDPADRNEPISLEPR